MIIFKTISITLIGDHNSNKLDKDQGSGGYGFQVKKGES